MPVIFALCLRSLWFMCHQSYDSDGTTRDEIKERFALTMEFVENYLRDVVCQNVPFSDKEKNKLTFEVMPIDIASCSKNSGKSLSCLILNNRLLFSFCFLVWFCCRLLIWHGISFTLASTTSVTCCVWPKSCWPSLTVYMSALYIPSIRLRRGMKTKVKTPVVMLQLFSFNLYLSFVK